MPLCKNANNHENHISLNQISCMAYYTIPSLLTRVNEKHEQDKRAYRGIRCRTGGCGPKEGTYWKYVNCTDVKSRREQKKLRNGGEM